MSSASCEDEAAGGDEGRLAKRSTPPNLDKESAKEEEPPEVDLEDEGARKEDKSKTGAAKVPEELRGAEKAEKSIDACEST